MNGTRDYKDNSLNSKVLKYEEFLNDKLKTDLRHVHEQRDKLYTQISEYMQFKRVIETIQLQNNEKQDLGREPIVKTQIDLGCNFYCQAVIPNASRVYVLIGYGYFLEMTLPESLEFIEKKIKTLTLKGQQYSKDSAKIKAHIRLVMEGLREIQNLTFNQQQAQRDVF